MHTSQAKEELEKLFNSGDASQRDAIDDRGHKPKIVLYNLGRDKYFRLLASVKVGNIDVAEYLIKKGLLNLIMEALKQVGSIKKN